jgi:P4 family phage/plasmid primase-like protien
MEMTSQFKDLNEFLAKHNAKNEKLNSGISATHTRIGDKELNIYGGSYIIPKEVLSIFHSLYHDSIFKYKKNEYLTEKQLDTGGQILVDFDFRYNYDVDNRQHTKEHIQDMILLYLEEIKKFFKFEANRPFDIFIMEKPNVNRLSDKSLTKDGIHMIIGIQMDHTMQLMLREKILEELPTIWDLPLINSWDSVLDEGISKGSTNWQLFGSRKPGNQAYELSQHFVINYDNSDGEFMMDELNIDTFNIQQNFIKLSAQNDISPKFEINPKIVDIYNKRLETSKHRFKKINTKTRINILLNNDDSDNDDYISMSEITNFEMLQKAIDAFINSLKPSEYELKETHEYTQTLPAKYYEPGSHILNRSVAFALKHTDDRLFLSWVMLRSKASDFDYGTIPDLYSLWSKYFNKKDGYTKRSIMYWSKQDAYEEYIKVKSQTIDKYIEETIFAQTDFDLAMVLYQMYKDRYVCSSITHKTWYAFKNHKWESDQGLSLRLAISKDMFVEYQKKSDMCAEQMHHCEANDDNYEYLKRKCKCIVDISLKLKRTNDKNNIMREAMELFYDNEFIKQVDGNKYLLCFKNGIVDFKTKEFRSGYPQDYITKTTGIDYIVYDEQKHQPTIHEIVSFMAKLFPDASLNKYMWDHLASCLIGTNLNQTFNIYRGSGSNGKSILTDLMSQSLGDYKGTVPITLVTEKRNGIGGTSSEVIQLKGIRYAVMQEPSKDSKINEGVMKELTGGDPVQGRALYCESEIFEPQFKLVVCTNSLFEINSQDDGTWRRIRICDFLSKFIDENEAHTDDTPYVFVKDKTLKERLPILAPIFMSILVKRAFETNGLVEDCDIVKDASNKYRQGQDHITGFVNDKIVKTNNIEDTVKKTDLLLQFKQWFEAEQGNRKQPKGSELYDYMDNKFGKCKKSGFWQGIKILYNSQQDIESNLISDLQNCRL